MTRVAARDIERMLSVASPIGRRRWRRLNVGRRDVELVCVPIKLVGHWLAIDDLGD